MSVIRWVLLIVCLLASGQQPSPARADNPLGFRPFEGRPVSRVGIAGLRITQEFVVRRELATRTGMTFSTDALNQDLSRLENLNIFSGTDVSVAADGDSVAVTLTVTELPWLVPLLKLSITDENGFSLGPAVSMGNLMGRDISLSAALLLGGTTQFDLLFSYPWITWNHLSLEVYAAKLSREDVILDFTEDSFEFRPSMGLWIGRAGRLRAGLDYLQIQSDQSDITLDPSNTDHMLGASFAVGVDTRNSLRNPMLGWHHELRVSAVGGDADFTLTELDLRRYQPFLTPYSTLALGVLTSVRSGLLGTDIPEYLAYRMGGANTIRGYEYQTLGAQLFGRNQMIATAEYRYLVMPLQEVRLLQWSPRLGVQMAAFVDFATAWDQSEELALQRFKTGYGLGVRLLVPGNEMLRFDAGWSEDGDFAFHVRALSKFDAQRNRLR